MNNREKEILAILRRNPLIQQNEIFADMLQISRSRVAAHIMDLMRKGRIKGKGYILTEQEYCVVVGTINMDICGWRISVTRKRLLIPVPFIARQAALDGHRPQSGAVRPRRSFAFSDWRDDFYGEMPGNKTRRAGVNVSGCVRLHGQSTSTYLAIANRDDQNRAGD